MADGWKQELFPLCDHRVLAPRTSCWTQFSHGTCSQLLSDGYGRSVETLTAELGWAASRRAPGASDQLRRIVETLPPPPEEEEHLGEGGTEFVGGGGGALLAVKDN